MEQFYRKLYEIRMEWGKMGTYPARRETGPRIQSPPSSKYLKQPLLNTARFASGYKSANNPYHTNAA